MVEEVRSAWNERIDTRVWLDDFSRNASKEKVNFLDQLNVCVHQFSSYIYSNYVCIVTLEILAN